MAAPIRSAHLGKMKFNTQLLSAFLRRQNISSKKVQYRCYHIQRNSKIKGANHHLFKRFEPALVCGFQAHRLDSTDAAKTKMAVTLENVLETAGPYDMPLRVKVIAVDKAIEYTNDSGESKQSLDFVIGDRSRVVRVRNYDPAKSPMIKAGNSLIINNYITKSSGIFRVVLTSSSKVFKTSPVETVPDAESLAENELNPPPVPEVPLKDLKKLPLKTMVSIKGQVVQEEMAQTVMVFNNQSTVKAFILASDEAKCRLSLWRDLAFSDIKTGDFISVTNVIVGSWNMEVSLSSTNSTEIEIPVESIKAGSTLPDSTLVDSANYIPEPPPIPKSILDTLELNALGEPTLQSLGLGKFTPPGFVQQALEFFHAGYGIPWWGTIVIGTLIVRLCLFPIYVYSQRISINMTNHMPTVQKLQERLTEARIQGDHMEAYKVTQELIDYMKRNNLQVYKSLAMPFAQLPVFLSWFGGLRGMTYLPVESMKTGGMLWFTDLTKCDPYLLLPLYTACTMAVMIKFGSDSMPLHTLNPKVKIVVMVLPVAIFMFTAWFPSALSVYWAVSNTFSLIQFAFLQIPVVRKKLKIPERVKHPKVPGEKKGLVQGFRENMDNSRLMSIIQDRQRMDSVKFEKAGQGAVPKTYDYNPKTKNKEKVKQRQ